MKCFYLAKSILLLCSALMFFQLYFSSEHLFEVSTLIPLGIFLISLDLVLNLQFKPSKRALKHTSSTQYLSQDQSQSAAQIHHYSYQAGTQYLSGFGIGLLMLSFIMQS